MRSTSLLQAGVVVGRHVRPLRHLLPPESRRTAVGAIAALVGLQALPPLPKEPCQLVACHLRLLPGTSCPWLNPGPRETVVRMNDSTALVTGANKGIGKEIAGQLAAAGVTVYVGARDAGRGQ